MGFRVQGLGFRVSWVFGICLSISLPFKVVSSGRLEAAAQGSVVSGVFTNIMLHLFGRCSLFCAWFVSVRLDVLYTGFITTVSSVS